MADINEERGERSDQVITPQINNHSQSDSKHKVTTEEPQQSTLKKEKIFSQAGSESDSFMLKSKEKQNN